MNNLRLLRKQKGISQQKLADILNVSQQSIYKYENGLSEPDIQTLKAMARFFNTSIDYLVGNTNFPYRMEVYTKTEVTQDELRHLQIYRNLPPHRRTIVDSILEDYNTENKAKNE